MTQIITEEEIVHLLKSNIEVKVLCQAAPDAIKINTEELGTQLLDLFMDRWNEAAAEADAEIEGLFDDAEANIKTCVRIALDLTDCGNALAGAQAHTMDGTRWRTARDRGLRGLIGLLEILT